MDFSQEDFKFLFESDSLLDNVMEKVYSIRPVVIITYGPPGCGKSNVLQRYLSKPPSLDSEESDIWRRFIEMPFHLDSPCVDRFTIDKTFNIVPILHDEILHKIPSYNKYKEEFIKELNEIKSQNIEDYDEVSKRYRKVYDHYKQMVYLITGKQIDSAIANKNNILIETTGRTVGYLSQIIKKFKVNNYYVVLMTPFTSLHNIYTRVISRSKKIGRIMDKGYLTTSYFNSYFNFCEISVRCDESYIIDTESGETIYRKRYQNYKQTYKLNIKHKQLINKMISLLEDDYSGLYEEKINALQKFFEEEIRKHNL